MPTPGEIKKLYGEFKRYNPDKFIGSDQEQEECEYCGSQGRIVAWKITETFPYEYDLACGHCNNWRRVFPTRPSGPPANIMPPKLMKMDDIFRDGFVLDDPWVDNNKAKKQEYNSIDEMVDGIGSEIPF